MARSLLALVCVAVAALSVLPAAWDVWRIGAIALDQVSGPAAGTDFLNLYAGAHLFLSDPARLYDLDAQASLQHALTGWSSPLVPFFLPPHAALLASWLGLLPYGYAYVVWLALNCACLVLATHVLAPNTSGRWRTPIWSAATLLFLPTLVTLGQGQTSLVFLLGFAAFSRAGVLAWTLKPQLAIAPVAALVLARRWQTLLGSMVVVLALTALAVSRSGLDAVADYRGLATAKLVETVSADPVFLLGPTLLHASRWFLGTPAPGIALQIVLAATLLVVWRRGLAHDDARLLQLALVPLVAVLAAPYALIYELTTWLASFWLLWRYTDSRPALRRVLLWLVAPVLAAANVGVALPREGGADYAALTGLGLTGFVVWCVIRHPTTSSARTPLPVAPPAETSRPLLPARPVSPR
jgi:hypothetical protein